jgi:hypothetical protein
MCNPKSMAFLLCLLLSQIYLPAQDKNNIKFGKVSPADFEMKTRFDSTDDVKKDVPAFKDEPFIM